MYVFVLSKMEKNSHPCFMIKELRKELWEEEWMVAAVKENKIHTWELQKKEGGEKEEGKEMGRD